MASIPTLSWSSSSLLQSFGESLNETQKFPTNKTGLLIFAQKKAKKVRKIILKEDVDILGKKGQILDVRPGYFRNYLLPTGKAQIITPEILKEHGDILEALDRIIMISTKKLEALDRIIMTLPGRREMQMEEQRIEAEKKRVKEEAQQLALIFETVGAFKVKRKGGKGKQIFGSVTSQDLVDIIKAQLQREVDKRIVSLPEIRETGEYIAELKLHPEVTARVRVNVFAN